MAKLVLNLFLGFRLCRSISTLKVEKYFDCNLIDNKPLSTDTNHLLQLHIHCVTYVIQIT